MAKALFGHVGVQNDARLVAEVQRLRCRVRDLEDELARLHEMDAAIHGALSESVLKEPSVEDLREPALA